MITAIAFAVAAAAGALARAEASRRWNRRGGLAAGTLVVNATGSLLLGLMSGWTGPGFTVLGVGALGAFTTFSSFTATSSLPSSCVAPHSPSATRPPR